MAASERLDKKQIAERTDLPSKTPTVTIEDVTLPEVKITRENIRGIQEIEIIPEQKEVLVVRCPDNKPSSFRFTYNEHYVTEDKNHFHRMLQKYKLDPKPQDYDKQDILFTAMKGLRARKAMQQNRGVMTTEDLREDNFEVDRFNERTIVDFLYEDLKAKQVKMIGRHPFRFVWLEENSREVFCMHEEVADSKLRQLQARGIDINLLKLRDKQAYYDCFNRCFDTAKHELNGRHYCNSHYKYHKYGRDRFEDMSDQP